MTTTIQEILNSISGRTVPKCPLTFLVYAAGQIIPAAATTDVTTVVTVDDILNVIESGETFAHDGTQWRLVGTTAADLAALLLKELPTLLREQGWLNP